MRLASHLSWERTTDRSARTAPARAASHHRRFVEMAREQIPDASDAEITELAQSLRQAHFVEMARRSVEARRRRSQRERDEKQTRIRRELDAYRASRRRADGEAA